MVAPSHEQTLDLAPTRGRPQVTGMKRLLLSIAALACLANDAPAQPQPDQPDIAGVYDGSSFETYMALRLLADGSFEWVLAVGGLDLRSQGVWEERDGIINFTTRPTPVPAEFRFLRFEAQDQTAQPVPQVHVTGPNGRPFTNADTRTECANGTVIYDFVAGSGAYYADDGDDAPAECDLPVAVTVVQSNYDVTSPRFDLPAMGWQPGQALHLEFIPNDIGVHDLTGMHGTIVDGVLTVDGPLGVTKFRKMPDRQALPE